MRCRGVCNGRRKPIDADLRETVGRSGGLSLLLCTVLCSCMMEKKQKRDAGHGGVKRI
jgi:hypothetical protein